ncbi:hypothetical protein N7468_007286 [Penicillium chermesinum]|uniref:Uncharacterized protein n=1 Tax=Penicillium chermesinum TaxID=63820 RepID=A0A9W9NUI7_9EURO|nr:uncharacterized protein N7468_007286 [Penicillium chermesinum]KAJ5226061.1 hypothetical protein N7468_007286 [Penicillium chermesinum]
MSSLINPQPKSQPEQPVPLEFCTPRTLVQLHIPRFFQDVFLEKKLSPKAIQYPGGSLPAKTRGQGISSALDLQAIADDHKLYDIPVGLIEVAPAKVGNFRLVTLRPRAYRAMISFFGIGPQKTDAGACLSSPSHSY